MTKHHFLTPGPSELYYTIDDHVRYALRHHVCAISHRSKEFQQIFKFTVDQLRELMQIPDDYHIVFTGSATEIWERIIQNLASENTYHLVNGSFSGKFYEFSAALKRNAVKYEVKEGEGFDLSQVNPPEGTEVICLTHNETSTGVSMPLEDIYEIRRRYPDALIAVDAVSSAPYPWIDFRQVDTVFFSVQKCFGLPAGLGVWIFNNRCVEKAEQLKKRGLSIGTYHTIPSLLSNAKKNETPETPNMLGIYLLGKVCEDMNRRSIAAIRQETNYKATLMYHAVSHNKNTDIFVKDERFRSRTVIVADVDPDYLKVLNDKCKAKHITLGGGYGTFKDRQIRIANFPTHSREIFEQVADILLSE